MKLQFFILPLLCSFLFLPWVCSAQSNDVTSTNQKIEQYFKDLEKIGFSGAILAAHEGEVLHSAGYGKSDVTKNIDCIPETVFDIGSITKQFTGAGILKLEMQGQLKVEDKISKYFVHLPEDKQDITIHQLLTHSSGLKGAIGDDYEETTDKGFLEQAMGSPLSFEDASKFRYSNVGYSILGLLIEKLSGMTYEQYLYKNLWKPAGMESTGYSRPNFKQENVAVGYQMNEAWGKPNEKNWGKAAPYWHLKANGGILSTVEDMHKWHEALLSDKILSEQAKQKYYHPHVKEGEDSGSHYGYGWALFPTPRNTTLVAHNGGNGIFFADFWRYFTEEITIIVMTNQSKRYVEMIASNVAGIILKPDFEPALPDANTSASMEKKVASLANDFIKAVTNEDPKTWEDFIKTKTTKAFEKFAPMDAHIGFFKQFHHKLITGEIVEEKISEDNIRIIIDHNGEKTVIHLGVEENRKGELKVGGIFSKD